MPRVLNVLNRFFFSMLISVSTCSYAEEPWFTGPLLATPAETVPRGHVNLELYGYAMSSNQIYNRHSDLISTAPFRSMQFIPELIYGLTDRIDLEWDFLYLSNRTQHVTSSNVGDTAMTLGFQVLRQDENPASVDLRATVQEIFPSGRFDYLLASNQGTDATGAGSYQTVLGLNFQHLTMIAPTHYLNTHLSMSYLYASNVAINKLNAYGGNDSTHGHVKPGSLFALDLAGEFSLTQQWSVVLESYFQYKQTDTFSGQIGTFDFLPDASQSEQARLSGLFPTRHNVDALDLGRLRIGNGTLKELSLAPALEYNFSKNYGLIAGCWFSVYGKSTPTFTSAVLALNLYW